MQYPKVSIVITTYKPETKPYLDLAVESVDNLSYPKEKLEKIIISKKDFQPKYFGWKTIAPEAESFYNPHGCNEAIKQCAADSEYIFLLNDDVVCTKDCLQALIGMQKELSNKAVLIPIGNCHLGWKYFLFMGYQENGQFIHMGKRQAKIDEWLPIKDKLMNANSQYPPGVLIERSLCLYAALYPKQIFTDVGLFDEQFTVGQDDIDFSLRATQKGYAMGICINSLVWHFSGATSSTRSEELRKENIERFKTKWGFYPFLNM